MVMLHSWRKGPRSSSGQQGRRARSRPGLASLQPPEGSSPNPRPRKARQGRMRASRQSQAPTGQPASCTTLLRVKRIQLRRRMLDNAEMQRRVRNLSASSRDRRADRRIASERTSADPRIEVPAATASPALASPRSSPRRDTREASGRSCLKAGPQPGRPSIQSELTNTTHGPPCSTRSSSGSPRPDHGLRSRSARPSFGDPPARDATRSWTASPPPAKNVANCRQRRGGRLDA